MIGYSGQASISILQYVLVCSVIILIYTGYFFKQCAYFDLTQAKFKNTLLCFTKKPKRTSTKDIYLLAAARSKPPSPYILFYSLKPPLPAIKPDRLSPGVTYNAYVIDFCFIKKKYVKKFK